MKSITFTVQIQADFTERDLGKASRTRQLCRDINEILARYDGMTGGAQVISRPKTIMVTTTAEDWPKEGNQ